MAETPENETLPASRPEPVLPAPRTEDRSADVQCVNRLVRRTGCTIREATRFLEDHTRAEQRELAAGKIDRTKARDEELQAALKQLEDAGIDPADPCPLGAPKKGPKPTWGDRAARLVYEGRGSSVAELVRRGAA